MATAPTNNTTPISAANNPCGLFTQPVTPPYESDSPVIELRNKASRTLELSKLAATQTPTPR